MASSPRDVPVTDASSSSTLLAAMQISGVDAIEIDPKNAVATALRSASHAKDTDPANYRVTSNLIVLFQLVIFFEEFFPSGALSMVERMPLYSELFPESYMDFNKDVQFSPGGFCATIDHYALKRQEAVFHKRGNQAPAQAAGLPADHQQRSALLLRLIDEWRRFRASGISRTKMTVAGWSDFPHSSIRFLSRQMQWREVLLKDKESLFEDILPVPDELYRDVTGDTNLSNLDKRIKLKQILLKGRCASINDGERVWTLKDFPRKRLALARGASTVQTQNTKGLDDMALQLQCVKKIIAESNLHEIAPLITKLTEQVSRLEGSMQHDNADLRAGVRFNHAAIKDLPRVQERALGFMANNVNAMVGGQLKNMVENDIRPMVYDQMSIHRQDALLVRKDLRELAASTEAQREGIQELIMEGKEELKRELMEELRSQISRTLQESIAFPSP